MDEFHHAAAPRYKKLLECDQPKILLGLAATPERMDGKSILPYFNNRIAAEIRLPEAIDRKPLCPFQCFGVTENIDLDTLRWSAGGCDKTELSDLYPISGAAANHRLLARELTDATITAIGTPILRSSRSMFLTGALPAPGKFPLGYGWWVLLDSNQRLLACEEAHKKRRRNHHLPSLCDSEGYTDSLKVGSCMSFE